MQKTLIDCGNCGPDYNSIRQMVQANFDAIVLQTHSLQDTLEMLAQREVSLVTVNRKLDRDYTDGMEVIRGIKADPRFADLPVMLVTNYDEHQQAAEKEGAIWGFGKLTIRDPLTIQRLQPYLGSLKESSKSTAS